MEPFVHDPEPDSDGGVEHSVGGFVSTQIELVQVIPQCRQIVKELVRPFSLEIVVFVDQGWSFSLLVVFLAFVSRSMTTHFGPITPAP